MTAPQLDIELDLDLAVPAAPAAVPLPRPRNDGLVRVQMVPLVAESVGANDDVATPAALVPQQLVVDYTAALAPRAAKAIRSGLIEHSGDLHQHPEHVACLRCAIVGSTAYRALATALLEILALRHTDEEWNNDPHACSDDQLISRLRRAAVSDSDLEEVYGPRWAAVLLTCLRAEVADLEMMDCLTQCREENLLIGELIDDPVATRHALAAYQLATVCCPRESRRGDDVPVDLKRNRIARRFAVAVARVALGETTAWLDHLPSPPL